MASPMIQKPVIVTRTAPSITPTSGVTMVSPGMTDSREYAKDNHTLTIALIMLYIITFFIYVTLEVFFVFYPVRRMEQKFDETTAKVDVIVKDVKLAAKGVDRLVDDIEEWGTIALAEFDKIKGGVCKVLHELNVDLPFCSENKVATITSSTPGNSSLGVSRHSSNVRSTRSSCQR